MTGRKRFDTTAGLWLAVALGAALRFFDLGAQSYSMDELWELTVIGLPLGEVITVGDGFPPLFHLVFKALVVGGFGDFSGRVFSAVLGVAAVWLTGLLGRRISPQVGVGAAFGVAVAPLLVLLSKEARAYGLFILLATLLLLATTVALDSGTTRSWIGFGAVLVLGMYTHYMFALAVASAELVVLWTIRRDHQQLRRWLYTHCAAAVALIPLILVAIPDFAIDASNSYSPTVDIGAIGYTGLSLFTGFTLGPSTRALHTMGIVDAISAALPWLLIIGSSAIYLFVHGWKALSPSWRLRLGVPLLMPLVLLSLFSAWIGVAFRVRYLSWLVVPLAIWLVAGFLAASGKARFLAGTALIAVMVLAIGTRLTIDEYKVEDARAAAEYVAANPDLPAVALAWYMTKPIEYYLGEESATVLPEDKGFGRFEYHEQLENRVVQIPPVRDDDPNMTRQADVLERVVDPGEEYLFIYSRPFHGDPEGRFLDARREADGLRPVADYAGITIYRGVRGELGSG
ncbi:MAG: glycosyltransferase family 39 protein [Acidimicrobiia bacterium]|nr:glycosyltransferase family 39 protein [Acidimicrobiia bacterium]